MPKKRNLFLTGAPSSGKTTIIKKLIAELAHPANGFYTEEELVNRKRVGFLMKTLDGKQAYLAHQDIPSDFRIRRYGVSLEAIEAIAVPAIAPVGSRIIILDEIGKMECFSPAFIDAAQRALDAPNIVIGTITFGGGGFILQVKERDDLEIIEVTPDNREDLPEILLHKIAKLSRLPGCRLD
ncbi:MAG: nucleoside-triphosphatase [Waddliaceae bacterium]